MTADEPKPRDYTCKKPFCAHCEYMRSRRPELDEVVEITLSPWPENSTIGIWKGEQVKFVRENYNKLSYRQIGSQIRKSPSAVFYKAQQLNLGVKNRIHNTQWC